MPQIRNNNKGRPGSVIAVDISEFTEAFLCNETGDATADLAGVNGNDWTNATGSLLAPTGYVEDPAGTLVGRGGFNPIGTVATDIYVSQAFSAGDIWDIRGKTSCTFCGWHKLNSGNNMNPWTLAIHNPSAANGQAVNIYTRNTTVGAGNGPMMLMFDGLTLFNALSVKATNLAVNIANDVWQFIAGGYDAVRNKIFCFWGRSSGEYYYQESDGFGDGFGYTGAAGCTVSLHRFSNAEPSSTNNTVDATDQLLWYNSRALTEVELVFLWNNHVGRATSDLQGTVSRSVVHNDHGRAGNNHGIFGNRFAA